MSLQDPIRGWLPTPTPTPAPTATPASSADLWSELDAAGARLLPGPVHVARTGAADPLPHRPSPEREDLAWHEAHWGVRPRGGLWLVDAVADAGLTGHGGGHFPAHRKWRGLLGRSGPLTLVGNAAESEPLSAKDATLLRLSPHLVLEGLALVAEALGAVRIVLWMHEGDSGTKASIENAVRERPDLDEVPVEIVLAPESYLAGEASAITQALQHATLAPTFRGFGRDRYADRSSPATLVHNVETLARVAVAARTAYRAGPPGRASSPPVPPQTRILTVLTPTGRCVLEVDSTATLDDAIGLAASGEPGPDVPVLLGGYGGSWARWGDVSRLTVTEHAFREVGLTLGAGIVAPLPETGCGLAETAAIADYLARASAGQCGPCLFGLPAVAERVGRLAQGRRRASTLDRLRRDLEAVRGRGACHHPDGVVRLVESALDVFPADVEAHLDGRACAAAAGWIPVPGVTS